MLFTLVYLVLFIFGTIGGVVAWYYLWFLPGYCSLPEESNQDLNASVSKVYISLSSFAKSFYELLKKLDSDYWIRHTGLDGFGYLYVQRKMLKLLVLFLVEYIIIHAFFKNVFPDRIEFEFFNLSTSHVDFGDKLVLREQILFIMAFTLTLIIVVIGMIREIRDVYLKSYEKHDTLDLKYLQMRSLHIKGMIQEDIRGEVLKGQIDEFLKEIGTGKMISVSVIPNYSELITLEAERKELKLMWRLLQTDDSHLKWFWIPSKLRNKDSYDEAMKEIDDKIQAETENRFLVSGHAFICFDNVHTLEKASEYLKMDAKKFLNLTLKAAKDIKDIQKMWRKSARTSTFLKFDDELANLEEKYKDVELFMKEAPEPYDIIWENLSGPRGLNIFRRITMMAFAFGILVFFTTPNEVYRLFNDNIYDFSQYKWAYAFGEGFGKMMQSLIPPSFVLVVNTVLLVLMNRSTVVERHNYHSEFQLSIFDKSAFYLTFNMLIIPGLSYKLRTSFFNVVTSNLGTIDDLLDNFYSLDSGPFFLALILQTALIFVLMNFLRLTELRKAYFSPWIAYFKRQFFNDEQMWMKKPTEIFSYGYNSARNTTIFFIVMAYSTTLPMMVIAGIVCFAIAHVVDSYNLLTYHRMEIDTFGNLFKKVISTLVIYMLLWQVFLIGSWAAHGNYLSIGFLGFNIFVLSLFYLYLRRPFFSFLQLQKASEAVSEIDPDFLKKWKKLYRHPLILKDEEFVVPEVQIQMAGRRQTWIAKETSSDLNIELRDNTETNRASFLANF